MPKRKSTLRDKSGKSAAFKNIAEQATQAIQNLAPESPTENALVKATQKVLKTHPVIKTAVSKIAKKMQSPKKISCAEARTIKRKSARVVERFTWLFTGTPLQYQSPDDVIEYIIGKVEHHDPKDDDLLPDQQKEQDIELIKKLFKDAELPMKALDGLEKAEGIIDFLRTKVKQRLDKKIKVAVPENAQN